MSSKTFHFLAIVLLVLFSSFGLLESQAQSRDQQLIAGLRDRRLFELAESFCRQKLAAPNLDDAAKTELTVELLRTYALHAIHEAPAERAKWSW